MAVFKNTAGKWVASYNGEKQYFSSQSAALRAYNAMKGSGSSGSSGSSAPKESVADTVARAKALLGDAYDPNTKAPTAARMDEIANQSFIDPKTKAAYEKTKLNPVNQNYISETYNANLLRASAPTTASDINVMGSTNLPTETPSYGSPVTGYARTQGIDTYEQSRLKQIEEEEKRKLEAEKLRQKEGKKLWDQYFGDVQSPSEVRDEAWDETGVDAKEHFARMDSITKEVDVLNTQYNNLEAARDQQIAETTGMMASMSFIDNRTAQIKRNAAPELNRISAQINSKAALMEALRGNFADAQTYVRQAVEDAVADYKFRADMYQDLYDMNVDNFNATESIFRDSYTAKMEEERLAYERALADKTLVGQLLIANPQAGIDITDTLDEAYRKIGLNPMSPERRLIEAQILNTLDNANGGGGEVPAGWKSLEARQDAGADAADYLDLIDSGTMTLEQAFTRLKTKYGSEATDEALWALLGGQSGTQEPDATQESKPKTSLFQNVYRDELGNLVPYTRVTAPGGNYSHSTPAYDYETKQVEDDIYNAVWGLK